jgi:hypothetical protein
MGLFCPPAASSSHGSAAIYQWSYELHVVPYNYYNIITHDGIIVHTHKLTSEWLDGFSQNFTWTLMSLETTPNYVRFQVLMAVSMKMACLLGCCALQSGRS